MAEVTETLEGALAAALAHASWSDTIGGVKSIVTTHLEALHSGARVRHTNFFNHSFAPDLTLSWPESPEPDRQVFLRFPDRPALIAQSVTNDIPEGSVVVGLGELEQREDAPLLAQSSRNRDTLVMDPAALNPSSARRWAVEAAQSSPQRSPRVRAASLALRKPIKSRWRSRPGSRVPLTPMQK
jgi:hypothetical protein